MTFDLVNLGSHSLFGTLIDLGLKRIQPVRALGGGEQFKQLLPRGSLIRLGGKWEGRVSASKIDMNTDVFECNNAFWFGEWLV